MNHKLFRIFAAHMAETLKEKTAKGLFWGALNNGATQVLNLVFGIFLARLLSTEDYGIVALISIFTLLAGCIQSAGFAQALANLKTPTQRDYNAVGWFNIIAGCCLYALLFCCAPLIAWFFEQPELTDVSRLAFLTIPISAAGIIPNAKLWIELRNREQAIATIIALLTSGCCGVWMAWNGWAYWSLVWQQVIFTTVTCGVKYYFTRWTPTLPIDFSPIRKMFRFSSKMLLTNILNIISQNVLTFIFGKMLPISSVGLFNQANKWNSMGSSLITNTMGQVAQPVLASVNDEEGRQERVFRKMLRFTSFLSFPLMSGLALVAYEFILFTIGPKWEESVVLLQILCISGACIPLHSLYHNAIISNGRSDIYLRLVAIQIMLQIAIALCLTPFGITTVVIAFSALSVVLTFFWHLALQRIRHITFKEALSDTVPFALISIACMAVTGLLTAWAEQLWLRLVLRVVIAAALYMGSMKLLRVKTLDECLAFIFKRTVAP